MKGRNERTARERIAEIPLSSQDTRKISADQLAEVLAKVDGKRSDPKSRDVAREENEISGARPVALQVAGEASAPSELSPPSSTQRITVNGGSASVEPQPVIAPVITAAPSAIDPATIARASVSTTKPRTVPLLFVLAVLMTALYFIVRH